MQVPHTAKVILCGEYGVGKSSLFRRFSTNTFTNKSGPSSTIGLDHFAKEYQFGRGDAIILDLWDTGGMERVATITSNYYKHATAAILVCDKSNRCSLSSLPHHLLEVVMHASASVQVFLCLTKDDLRSNDGPEDEITQTDLEEFRHQAGDNPGIAQTFITSSKSSSGVEEMFAFVAKTLFDARKQIGTSPSSHSGLCLKNRDSEQDNCAC